MGSAYSVIGIDIGGTKTRVALFDEKFNELADVKMGTRADKDEKQFTENFRNSVNAVLARAKQKKRPVTAVGVGCAGSIDLKQGLIKESPNIPFLRKYPLRARLEKWTGLTPVLMNDVQAGLYGEHRLGVAIGHKNALGIFIGTGIGGALIIDGRLYEGSGGRSGDIGHYLVYPMGLASGWNREGTLDELVSRTAIVGQAAVLAAKQWAKNLLKNVGTDVGKIGSGDLARAIKDGDKCIEQLVMARSRLLGIALSNLVDFLNPDIVVLGGGFVDALPDLVCREVRAGIEENASADALDGLEVAVSKLKKHAVTVGAARMALDSGTYFATTKAPMST